MVAAVLGCGRPGPPARPNVLLVTIDTQRADHSPTYGYRRPTTPRLDRLARDGVCFTDAYTPTPTTGPSHASLLTSRYPLAHGVLKNAWHLGDAETTLAEILRGAGYRTAAVVSAFPLARRFGYAQGFDHYDDRFSAASATIAIAEWEGVRVEGGYDRRADETAARALAWAAAARRPFFLWVHFYDPHSPYDPPGGYRALVAPHAPREGTGRLAATVAAYDAEIRFADEQLGHLLDALAGRPDTIVVVATDHGEGLGQHGVLEHGVHLHEELVRTVLVVSWPGRIAPGRRVGGPVSLLDVVPTLLGLLALPDPAPAVAGEDLSPVLLGTATPRADRVLYFQRRFFTAADRDEWPVRGEMFALRQERWKYIEAGDESVARQLFDLAADPAETRDLSAVHPDRAAALAALLRRWRAEHRRGQPRPEPRVSAEDEARLRALGYLE
jgi:arylsulfatase A-like enzyme